MTKYLYFLTITLLFSCVNRDADYWNKKGLNSEGIESIKYFKKAIELDSNSAILFYNIGFEYHHLKDYSNSIKYLEKSISINDSMSKAYEVLGINYYFLGKDKEAIEILSKSISYDSSYSDTWLFRGMSYYILDSNKLAIYDLTKYFDLHKNRFDSSAFSALFAAKANLNDFKDSERLFEKWKNNFPSDPFLYFMKGTYYSHFSEFDSSIKMLNVALNLFESNNHNYGQVLNTTAKVYHYSDNLNKACNYWNLAFKYNYLTAKDSIDKYCNKLKK